MSDWKLPGRGMLLIFLTMIMVALPVLSAEKPLVQINQAEFRDRIFACWMGKNIGGTLGMPFEGKKEPQEISYYTNLKPGEPAANDDLDRSLRGEHYPRETQ